MRYYIDTEFIEYPFTIDLISLGIVSEDGRMLYMINADVNLYKASDWVRKNVLFNMEEYNRKTDTFNITSKNLYCHSEFKNKVLDFIGSETPEFWGYYSDYDWVVFCWIFGRMIDLPKHFPMFCNDLRQLELQCGNVNLEALNFVGIPKDKHNALYDACWTKEAHKFLLDFNNRKVW
jgi:hypothetical protein